MAPDDRGASSRAFGAENRRRLIDEFLDAEGPVDPASAWKLAYRLLLWVNRAIGLAHCYEADKCTPGRPWYARSLAFHAWLASELEVDPDRLGSRIDHLFRTVVAQLAEEDAETRAAKAAAQRAGFEALPEPGEDAEMVDLVRDALGQYLEEEPPAAVWRDFTAKVAAYFFLENKRKNLLGEGFEDTIAALVRRLPRARTLEVHNRVLLGDIPGFQHQGVAEKAKRVDLALWEDGGTRSLVTAKWSVRADREEQFGTDFDAYVRVNQGAPFEYILVTNEFDAARLKAACRRLAGNAPLFTAVVHINPEGVLRAYEGSQRGAATVLRELVSEGRLISLGEWLAGLVP